MPRRVYIISKDLDPQDYIAQANALNCSEIIKGIPEVYKSLFQESDLPVAYEEPVVIPIDWKAEWALATTIPAKLKVLGKLLKLE